jgi:putative Ca2+/H+ antiporter (TMEM165/GDT1 family)
VLGVAEFGDLTQLATAGLAGSTGEPVGVAIGAWAALVSVAALAVAAGRWIERTVPLELVRRVAAVAFAGLGATAIVVALT